MRKLFLFLLIPFVLILVSFVFYIYELSAFSSDTSTKVFVVNQGDSSKIISRQLENNGLIRNRYVFLTYLYFSGLNGRLQAGTFELKPSLTTPEIISKLISKGNNDYWLKIIEGQRLDELTVKFDEALEGYVFPDSYLVPADYQPERIYSEIIKKNFDNQLAAAQINPTNNQLSLKEIVTLASLLEREGRSLQSKQQIAGIILNRLSIDMALQIDATVQYARDSKLSTKEFWTPLSKPDLSINSLYNTYLHPGLPPGPICNPGYDSLYAAYHPADNDYLYYITGNDGKMYYSSTLDGHNANIAKYLR